MTRWHKYRYGCTNLEPELWADQPRCLLVFSGKRRPGDLASYLGAEGWIVVIVDKVAPEPTDVLSEHYLDKILADTETGMYDVVGCATPCETLSPLRESPPGPRPLRSLKPDGLPSEELTESEPRGPFPSQNPPIPPNPSQNPLARFEQNLQPNQHQL